MNIEFTNKIAIIAASETPSLIEAPFSNFDILYTYIDVEPKAQQKNYKGNQAYEFKLQVTFRDMDQAIRNKYKFSRPVVVLLFDDLGNFYQVGTELIPIFVDINEQKLATEFAFIGKIPDSPF